MAPGAPSVSGARSLWRGPIVLALATGLTLLLLWRRWSHAWGLRLFGLPTLQQELNLFSENAFYYSFYRQILEARTLNDAIKALQKDDRTEHPEVIDALERFNVMPELLLGAAYKLLPPLVQKQMGRFAFYAGTVLVSNSVGSGVLCSLAWSASGGDLACAAAQFGLFVAMLLVPISRVIGVHVIALRENFALPILHVQTALLVSLLRKEADRPGSSLLFLHLTVLWLLSAMLLLLWQFSGFVLCAQTAALFAAFLLGRQQPGVRTLLFQVCFSFGGALALQGAMMPGGAAALMSPLPEVLAATAGTVLMRPYDRLCRRRGAKPGEASPEGLVGIVVHVLYAAVAFLALRTLRQHLGAAKLTEHVDELLKEKLFSGLQAAQKLLDPVAPAMGVQLGTFLEGLSSPKPTFDSTVYLDQDEFRALWDPGVFERHVLANGWRTALPLGVAAGSAALVTLLVVIASLCIHRATPGSIPVDLLFMSALSLVYCSLTALVWRLRVLSLPLLAVVGAQLISPRLWTCLCPCCSTSRRRGVALPSSIRSLRWALGLACLALSSCYLGHLNTFYDQGLNPDTEREDRRAQFKIYRWIQKHVDPGPAGDRLVIAGDATTLASARLALPNAAVVAHPHYEHPRARQRFRDAKEYFLACGPSLDAHKYARRLGVTHLILDLTRLAPQQAVSLSRFYKKSRRCSDKMGADLLGMGRTLFQIVMDDGQLFQPLHVAGAYILVKVLPQPSRHAEAQRQRAAVDPGSPESWRPLLDRCPKIEKEESCVEDLGLFVRVVADPMRQHGWVRAFAQDAVQRYPNSALLHALLGRTFDYDLSDFNEAARHYRRATELKPSSQQYWSALGGLLVQVWGQKSADEVREVLEQTAPLILGSTAGPGVRDIGAQRLCQAATWSKTLGLKSRWEGAFWQTARLRARFGCVLEQWANMEGSPRPWPQMALDFLLFPD